MRVTILHPLETRQLAKLAHPYRDRSPCLSADLECEADVLRYCLCGKQGIRLKHESDIAFARGQCLDAFTVDGQLSSLRLSEPGNNSKQGRFAAATSTEE